MQRDHTMGRRTLLGVGVIALVASGCARRTPTEIEKTAQSYEARAVENRAVAPARTMTMRFTVQFVGPVETPLPQCLFGHFRSLLEGHATHLGKFHGVGSTCLLTTKPDDDPPFLPPGPPPYATATFTNPLWVLTAADGDELWLQSTDAIGVLGGVNPADGSYTSLAARGTHRIIGGTGRFATATGELQTTAVNDDGQGPDDSRSDGWIRY